MLTWLLAIPRFLRLPNLLIVVLSQAIPYWCILHPAIARTGGIPALSQHLFVLLCSATVLTTLAGYVINDYFDRQIDAINKPTRQVVGKLLPPAAALVIYWALIAGITLLSLELFLYLKGPRVRWVLWLFPVVSFLLYLYAWQIKCMPVVGNLLVAVLCGIVPVMMLVPEDRSLTLAGFRAPDMIREAEGLVWIYAFFAFVTNLFREQIKDLEDFQGDSACGCTTLAVVRGRQYAQKVSTVTGAAVCALMCILLAFWQQQGKPEIRVLLGVLFLLFPVAMSTFLVFSGKTKQHFTRASLFLKIAMLAGLLLLIPEWPSDWEKLKIPIFTP